MFLEKLLTVSEPPDERQLIHFPVTVIIVRTSVCSRCNPAVQLLQVGALILVVKRSEQRQNHRG